MPSYTDFPRYAFLSAIPVAAAALELGGEALYGDVANKMGRKMGGGYRYLVTSAVQHGLISYSNWTISVTELYREIDSAGNQKHKSNLLKQAFLFVPLYSRILSEWGVKEDLESLGSFLRNELGVDSEAAKVVSRNYVEGAKSVGLTEPSDSYNAPAERVVTYVRKIQERKKQLDLGSEWAEKQPEKLDVPKASTEVRIIQILLPNRRLAELKIPADLTQRDLQILTLQLEVLKASTEV